MVIKESKPLLGIVAVIALCGGLLLTLTGCGAAKQEVTAPEPITNTPPGGGSADEYAKKMQELKGSGGSGGPGAGAMPGAPSAPGR